MSKLIRLPNGSKARIQGTLSVFGQSAIICKKGLVYNGALYPTLFDLEEAIVAKLYTDNRRQSLRFQRGTLSRERAFSLKEAYYWRIEEGLRLDFGEESTLAVACRLDSLGQIVDFLSLLEWAAIHHFKLPEGWHYFLPRHL